ncbi:MAG: helix-turn-helix domain-containing protein [Anaerolineales bacterium]
MTHAENKSEPLLRLSDAAEYLGVHFTTLRRWADKGDLTCFRTPGGRRRFKKSDLDTFLKRLRQDEHEASGTSIKKMDHRRIFEEVKHHGISGKSWLKHLNDSHRAQMRTDGRKLTALLMQYTSRSDGGEGFLERGQQLASHYGQTCRQVGFTLMETVQAFISIRRSIIDSLCETGMLVGYPDRQTWQLYQRVDHFLDVILLAILSSYQKQTQDGSNHAKSKRYPPIADN